MARVVVPFVICCAAIAAAMYFQVSDIKSKQRIDLAQPWDRDAAFKDFDRMAAATHLAHILGVKTVSIEAHQVTNPKGFKEIHNLYQKFYPLVHEAMEREVFAEYSLIYKWEGSDVSLKPICLMSHIDVVPVDNSTLDQWSHAPFGGVDSIADGFVYGRGAMDVKVSAIAFLEAAELLLANGFKPKRTIYITIGHDEEVGGEDGAAGIVELLKQRNVHFDTVLDEGGFVLDKPIPGVDKFVAMIGLAEKGMANLKLSVKNPGGHSAMPVAPTPIGILAKAISAVESNPFPASTRCFAWLTDALLAEMPAALRTALAFHDFPVIHKILTLVLGQNPKMNAFLRTSIAPTMLSGSPKKNVIPTSPYVNVNLRIIPGETVASVKKYVTNSIADERVTVELNGEHTEPSPVSESSGPRWDVLDRSIREVMPDVHVAPYLVIGGTDSKWYHEITDRTYRFLPMRMGDSDIQRIHGINERISIESLEEMVAFYYRYMDNAASA